MKVNLSEKTWNKINGIICFFVAALLTADFILLLFLYLTGKINISSEVGALVVRMLNKTDAGYEMVKDLILIIASSYFSLQYLRNQESPHLKEFTERYFYQVPITTIVLLLFAVYLIYQFFQITLPLDLKYF